MRTLIFITCLLLAMSASSEVYRSVDENGNVVFTDQPSPEAELIEIDELQTIKAPAVRKFKYTPPPTKPKERYTAVNITSPEHDTAIRDNGGNVTINVETIPGVRGGDMLVLYLDGKEIDMGNASSKTLTGVDRGTHQVRAAIKNEADRILLSSKSVTFHLLRQSIKPATAN